MLKALISLLFPQYCFICGKKAYSLGACCLECSFKYFSKKNIRDISHIPSLKPAFKVYSFWNYTLIYQKILREIKFGKRKNILRRLCQYLDITDQNFSFDYVTSIPISYQRYLQRGFNPAKEIAVFISKKFNIPYIKTLSKKHTKAQSKKHRSDRELLLSENIFSLALDPLLTYNKRLLLVDDIVTSGATVISAYNTLSMSGIKKIEVMSLFYSDLEKRDREPLSI